MAAASVTGTGVGSADGSNKGSEHTTIGVGHLIGTRVVAAGRKTLAAGVGTVTFPAPLAGSQSNYVVMTQAFNSTTEGRATALTDNSDGDFASFTLAGGTTDVVHWTIVKIGFDG